MLTAAETATTLALAAHLAANVTDGITLETARAIFPVCDGLIMDVCCMDDADLIHDTAARVAIVCDRMSAAHAFGKVDSDTAWNARNLARESRALCTEMEARV
jgi:hypothetical protein